jgi:hypothetical protein
MSTEFNVKNTQPSKFDTLHISKTKNSKTISANLSAFKYQDKSTGQFVIYVPSVEASSYGETRDKAEEMIKESLKDFCTYLAGLSKKEVEYELIKLGWKNNKIRKKDFSKSYVDVSGDLKDFAVDQKVEHETLVAC